MPSGFMQRFKGKVQFAAVWFGGSQVYGSGAINALTTASASQTIPPTAAQSSIVSSSAISIWTLGAIPSPGDERVISLISVSSGVFLKAAAGTSFDPSTNTVIKSTYAQTITLIGLSSLKWGIKSVFPPSTVGVAPNAGITLTTTT